jgi:uncharacterized protein
MNFENQTKKNYFNDFLLILLIIGSGFIIGQFISIIILNIFGTPISSETNNLNNIDNLLNANLLKAIQFFSALFTFVLPTIIISKLKSNSTRSFLKLNSSPDISYYFLIVLFILSIMPILNLIIQWNESIVFPEWLSGIESSMRASEESVKEMMELILSGHSHFDLAINIFLIAILPAIGEEFLFRGVLQKHFADWFKNIHISIIITAIIFSAIHMQFFGFFPRFLLGIFFGYLVYYTKSLWTAIWAHFFNNAMAIITMFYISRGNISAEIESFGTSKNDIYYVAIGIIASIIIGYQLFRKKKPHLL